MACLDLPSRYPLSSQVPATRVPEKTSLEHQIFARYRNSVILRLKLITALRAQGKLAPQKAAEEIQLLRSQLLQTQRDLGIPCTL